MARRKPLKLMHCPLCGRDFVPSQAKFSPESVFKMHLESHHAAEFEVQNGTWRCHCGFKSGSFGLALHLLDNESDLKEHLEEGLVLTALKGAL